MILVLLSLFQETQSSREILNLFKVPSDLGTLAGQSHSGIRFRCNRSGLGVWGLGCTGGTVVEVQLSLLASLPPDGRTAVVMEIQCIGFRNDELKLSRCQQTLKIVSNTLQTVSLQIYTSIHILVHTVHYMQDTW